jgi:hypothetical protein
MTRTYATNMFYIVLTSVPNSTYLKCRMTKDKFIQYTRISAGPQLLQGFPHTTGNGCFSAAPGRRK